MFLRVDNSFAGSARQLGPVAGQAKVHSPGGGAVGAVLLFSLVSMGIITVFTQQLMKSVSVGMVFTRNMVTREQVEMLAYGGISIAMAQLERCYEEEKKKEQPTVVSEQAKQQEQQKKFSFKTFIMNLVPHLNRWQEFVLTDAVDGLDAQIKICVTAEEGKLPIAWLFDEPARDLSVSAKQMFKTFTLSKKSPAGDFGTKLAAALKKRTHRMTDLSGLVPFAQELKIPFWYAPPVVPKTKKDPVVPAACAVQDLCTLWCSSARLNPLVLTNATCMVLGIRVPKYDDADKRKEQFKQLADNYEKIKSGKGEALWKSITALYDQKPKLGADFDPLFSLEVEPRFYSVLSCATVAGVTQQLVTILEKITPPAQSFGRRGQEQKKKKEEQPLFVIKRLYWL